MLSDSGLGETCLRIMQGGNTRKISKVGCARLGRRLTGGNRVVGRRLEAEGCGPRPMQEIRVPGPSNNIEGLKVPAMASEFMRRTVTRMLAPVCRRRFRSRDCKFEPGEYTRRTVLATLSEVGSNGS